MGPMAPVFLEGDLGFLLGVSGSCSFSSSVAVVVGCCFRLRFRGVEAGGAGL